MALVYKVQHVKHVVLCTKKQVSSFFTFPFFFFMKHPKWLESDVYTCNKGLLESGCRKQKHKDKQTNTGAQKCAHARTTITTCQCCGDGCPALLKYQLQGEHMSTARTGTLNTDSSLSCGGMLGRQTCSLTTATS